MKDLRRKFNRFCYQNRSKGIPNLMLYIVLGIGMVSIVNSLNGGSALTSYLSFDKAAILDGQIWRLFSYVFDYSFTGNFVLDLVFLYFFYRLGRSVEESIGTFKFNLFYFSGILLMSLFAMIFCPTSDKIVGNYLVSQEYFTYIYSQMGTFLHLSLILAFATSYPDSKFMIFFIIPISARIIAAVYLVLLAIEIFNMCYPAFLFPHCLFPFIGMLNYFIFFDVRNLMPLSWQVKRRQAKQKRPAPRTEPIPFRPREGNTPTYTHRCTVCGRTDISDPNLEFRYCSRCRGYYCYCQEHINNHSHIE